jgi:zinc D-Ala-D-Ala carboxypeptidase
VATEPGQNEPMAEPAEEAEAAGYDGGPDDTEPATEPDEAGEEDGEATEDGDLPEPEARGLATVRDRQRLLASVGFPIRVDGAAGPATTQAIRWFQEAWTLQSLAIDGVWGPNTEAAARQAVANGGRISAHFHLAEFACSHCRWPRANRALVRGLERLRSAHYTQGLSIVSGYRCVAHNTAIGGARHSQHLYGRAADIPPRGDGGRLVTVNTVAALRLFAGLEYQPKYSGQGCTHVDVRAGGDPAHPSIFAWG